MERQTNINIKHKWLGEIPSDWEIKPLNTITSLKSVKNHPHLQLLSLYRDYGVIQKSSRDDNHNRAGSDLSKYKLVSIGDLVINKMKAWQGSVGISKYEGIISPAYIICKVNPEIDSEYLNYLLRSNIYKHQYGKLSYGVRTNQWDIRYDDFKKLPVLIPSKPEQTSIANFLDYKLEKINRFISKKKQLIELLQEQKAAIINQAVTKGLNPNVKMKDSGVEWLGEIPENWEVKKLKYVANCFPSNVDKHSRPNEKRVRLCNYTDVYYNDFILDDMDLMIATASDDQIEKCTLLKGDVIITKDSETADDIAVPAYVKEDLTNVVCGYHLSVLRAKHKIIGEYLFRVLMANSINPQFEVNAKGVTRVGLGTYPLNNAKVPIPPHREQVNIVNLINEESKKVSTTISLIEKEITLAQEYKTSLIAEAVTGKIDVRDFKKNGISSSVEMVTTSNS
ncbi:MAG: restriction endonuclease subunit S [Chitinophagales bacterium]|nr:restriction endonuclease subunit S [Chitinophagales bacterium]